MNSICMKQGFSLLLLLVLGVGCTANKTMMKQEHKDTGSMSASDSEYAEVEAVVIGLFDAMRSRDADAVQSLFAEDAILQSTGMRNGEPMITKSPAENFAQAVREATGDTWDEKIWDLKIEVNNRLASAWMDYAFYLGDTLSHCGSNSFQLFKGEQGWKIIYLVDSRQHEGCKIPEHVRPAVNG